MMTTTSPASKIEALAIAAAEQATSEDDRKLYRKIAREARIITLGLVCRPLTHEEFTKVHGGWIIPTPEPSSWQADTVEAALAVDVAEMAYAEAEQALSDVDSAYNAARSTGMTSVFDRTFKRSGESTERLRQLQSAITVVRTDLEDAADALRASRVAHSALVRRDEHQHRLERIAAMEAEQERERQERERERRKSGREVLRRLAEKVTG